MLINKKKNTVELAILTKNPAFFRV